jgi:outer membrane protein assembly factor BamB
MKASVFLSLSILALPLFAEDWPTYRHDGKRTALSAEAMPSKIFAQWTFVPRHAPKTAWPLPDEETPRMHSDRALHVIVASQTAYFGHSVDDNVYAVDTRSGKTKWTFRAEGPVRFAPVFDAGKIYFGSDDGYAYCLDAANGNLIWRYRPSPANERIIGNGRMISLWPVRTGLLVEKGVVYLAAGVFPYEGLYIAAVDAKTGREIWMNDTAGDQAWGLHYGAFAPHGYLLATSSTLYVPTGRNMPAAFDKATGKFKHVLSTGGKIGGSWALVDGEQLVAGVNNQGIPAKIVYDENGGRRGDLFADFLGRDMVLTKDISYVATKSGVYAIDREKYRQAAIEVAKIKGARATATKALEGLRKREPMLKKANKTDELAKVKAEIKKHAAALTAMLGREREFNEARVKWFVPRLNLTKLALGGNTLFAGGHGFLLAIDTETGRLGTTQAVTGKILGLAIGDGRLFASSSAGPIYCLGSKAVAAKIVRQKNKQPVVAEDPRLQEQARELVKQVGTRRGWVLVAEAGSCLLTWHLAVQSDLNIVALVRDAKQMEAARRMFDEAGLLGSRVSVEPWTLKELPDYFANLIVSEGLGHKLPAKELARVLRPAGGKLIMVGAGDRQFVEELKRYARAETSAVVKGGALEFTRGKLHGAGSWTGLYGNVSNTSSSRDELVKGPLGVLWFGEPGSKDMVERHARTSSPLAINGRLFMQGEEVVMGYDAYNGAFLWRREIKGAVRVRVDVDGSNLAATDEAVFVATGDRVLQLDAQTGKTIREYSLPRKAGDPLLRWGYIAVRDGVLFGSGAVPLRNEYGHLWNVLVKDGKWRDSKDVPADARSTLANVSKQYPKPDLHAYNYFNRAGLHWQRMAAFPKWVPKFPKSKEDHSITRVDPTIMLSAKLFAFDIKTGKQLWERKGKSIPNISIVIGEGRVLYLEDDLTQAEKADAAETTKANIEAGVYTAEREQKLPEAQRDYRRVVCLEARSGQPLWSRPYDLTGSGGTKLGLAYQKGRVLAFGHYSNHDEGPFNKGQLNWRRITVMNAGGGSLLWSKPLNYRRRPTIVGDTIYIEPRRCSLATGEIEQRVHPITGTKVDWEFLRPGHSCGIVTGTPNSIFYRSFSAAIVNTEKDTGLQLFGGMRPGCWNSMIPANGLLSMQEGSSGCTCSYSLKTTVVLKHKAQKGEAEWAVFISQAANKPVEHLAVNFGAPGDMRAKDGTVWFGYPRPKTTVGQGAFKNYGIKFDLAEAGTPEVIQRDWRGRTFAGTDKPWLFTSGMKGATKFSVPLLEKGNKGKYTVRLGFTPLTADKPGSRVFGIKLQGKSVLPNLDVAKASGGYGKVVVREFKGVEVEGNLLVELVVPDLKGAGAIDVDSKLHHLGDNVVAGWTESSPEPKGFELKIPFELKASEGIYSLAIEQHHVNNDWAIMVNGREIGRLKKGNDKQIAIIPAPEGLLKQGANQMVIQAVGKSNDDIQVGRIKLISGHPASTVIQSLEVIREDGPRKVATKPQSR